MQGPEQGLMMTVKSTFLCAFALGLCQCVKEVGGKWYTYAAYSGSHAPALGYT
jgi:hypothetical protein